MQNLDWTERKRKRLHAKYQQAIVARVLLRKLKHVDAGPEFQVESLSPIEFIISKKGFHLVWGTVRKRFGGGMGCSLRIWRMSICFQSIFRFSRWKVGEWRWCRLASLPPVPCLSLARYTASVFVVVALFCLCVFVLMAFGSNSWAMHKSGTVCDSSGLFTCCDLGVTLHWLRDSACAFPGLRSPQLSNVNVVFPAAILSPSLWRDLLPWSRFSSLEHRFFQNYFILCSEYIH